MENVDVVLILAYVCFWVAEHDLHQDSQVLTENSFVNQNGLFSIFRLNIEVSVKTFVGNPEMHFQCKHMGIPKMETL